MLYLNLYQYYPLMIGVRSIGQQLDFQLVFMITVLGSSYMWHFSRTYTLRIKFMSLYS